ncbi:siderophore-interacting protein [Sphingobium cloacae]|uniref:FAD-binding 9 siderophore-interacting domain protein n=1 Tax=Sphingobium cloacae TaxID=120107 RepID=A0A1E1F4I2_9SPHN|nr:siderophore-interacting protein [Sphingobium cloacae]BAV65362.1 FAD-binding 9 siderophore-interacting domain protein [Sphingobium cloacae]
MKRRIRAWIERLFHSRIEECTLLRVVETNRITPHMLRVAFIGRDLEPFATNENLHVKLLLPPQGAARDHWLKEEPGGKVRLKGRNLDPVFRKYTIRSIDAGVGRVAIDFVCHEDGGPGAAWAAAAKPGDVVGMIGPGGRSAAPADWVLLAGDETGLPAIGRILESLSGDARGLALVEIDGPEEEQPLSAPPGVELRWLHRQRALAGTTDLLADAVKAVSLPGDGTRFAWVAGEFAAIQAIRRHLRATGLGKQEQLVVAYWRRDEAEARGTG